IADGSCCSSNARKPMIVVRPSDLWRKGKSIVEKPPSKEGRCSRDGVGQQQRPEIVVVAWCTRAVRGRNDGAACVNKIGVAEDQICVQPLATGEQGRNLARMPVVVLISESHVSGFSGYEA